MARELETAEAVINFIGAPRLARLTRRKPQHVWNWKAANRFPPSTFLILSQYLTDHGAKAAPSLWSIDEPAEAAQ